jgi:hypothetical protein
MEGSMPVNDKIFSRMLIFLLFFPGFLVAQEMNLDNYIRRSLDNSPAIRDFQNRIRSGQIDSMRIGAGMKPQ